MNKMKERINGRSHSRWANGLENEAFHFIYIILKRIRYVFGYSFTFSAGFQKSHGFTKPVNITDTGNGISSVDLE